MAYEPVNRVVAASSEAGWQKAVVRGLSEQISSPPPTQDDRRSDEQPLNSNPPDQSGAIAIIQRVSGLSIGELDKTIGELQKARSFLASEEERMRREMAEYLRLTQAAVSSTKSMAEFIARFGSLVTDAGNKPNIE